MIAFVLETQGLSSPSLLILVTITMILPIIAESNISKASHKCVVLKSSNLTQCNSGTIYAFISASFSCTWFDCLAQTHYTVCGSIQYRHRKAPIHNYTSICIIIVLTTNTLVVHKYTQCLKGEHSPKSTGLAFFSRHKSRHGRCARLQNTI